MYYINDGIYGSFNCLLHGHVKPTPKILQVTKLALNITYFIFFLQCSTNSVATPSIIWGPTCDSIDKVNSAFLLPELNVGDWLYYEDMGAYTVCAQSPFNGFSRPLAYYYCTDKERCVEWCNLSLKCQECAHLHLPVFNVGRCSTIPPGRIVATIVQWCYIIILSILPGF